MFPHIISKRLNSLLQKLPPSKTSPVEVFTRNSTRICPGATSSFSCWLKVLLLVIYYKVTALGVSLIYKRQISSYKAMIPKGCYLTFISKLSILMLAIQHTHSSIWPRGPLILKGKLCNFLIGSKFQSALN